jgi:acetylornithine/succinyldiaminopimelate/putrescine aminotransferase
MSPCPPVSESYGQILREQLPNLFRLYLNPYVAQTCLCLARYVQRTWGGGEYQSFLANSFDEALAGAIKLARYSASLAGLPTTGLVIDPAGRLGSFASAATGGGGRVEFVPGLVVIGKQDEVGVLPNQAFGFVVLLPDADGSVGRHAAVAGQIVGSTGVLVITCVDRASLAAIHRDPSCLPRKLPPDVVVSDESFANRDVAFGAFTARESLYDPWNRPGKTTFHSTTYQPNTIASLHFMNCLKAADPEFHSALAGELERINTDVQFRAAVFRRMYNPPLYKAIRQTGFETADVQTAGDFILADGRRVFDAVSGVACSVRGHNPAGYADEIAGLGDSRECKQELTSRLRQLTGLGCMLPAVSGASAVENALKIGLVAQYPRRHVLALKAGFGGKTLLALAGTWNAAYKEHLDPLYPDVLYIDPFAPDATRQIDAALEKAPVAVVQIELVQAVGGVRSIPVDVVRHLESRRRAAGFLLLVDEVQTGMYRTGPFTRSGELGLTPDLLVIGKGTSDMMFPFALTLYSDAVQASLDRAGSDLPDEIQRRYGYDLGYKTVLNVLRRAEELRLAGRVAETGDLFRRLLGDALAGCKAVREVRVHGLLIGIELDASRVPRRWFRKRLFWFYLYGMLRHRRYPVLAGFCQYEPNVLKITPSLTVEPAQVRAACATIAEVLRRPFYRLAAAVLGGLVMSIGFRRRKNEHGHATADEPVAHRVSRAV